jgi:WhiB family redox-sensing transcriptional regulator
MTTVVEPATKRCTVCDTVKSTAEFRARSNSDAPASSCNPCHTRQSAEARKERLAVDAVVMPAPTLPKGWRNSAACRDHDPELWFADPSNDGDTEYAKAVCDGCPVRRLCGDYALGQPGSIAGVWGGLTESERRSIKRSEARAREQRNRSRASA